MFKFLSKQIAYTYHFKKQFLIALFVGLLLAFIMVFLEPFNLNQIQSNYKTLKLSGFGVVLFLLYLVYTRVENRWYIRVNKRWEVKYEIVSFICFVFFLWIFIYLYNQAIINDILISDFKKSEFFNHALWFFQHALLPVVFILIPIIGYLRNKFGDLITPESLSEVEFSGINQGEKIVIQKEALLFVKASENYVEIYHEKDKVVQHETFRNTLTAINDQAPFLRQCHRSYLVNISKVRTVNGNSQNAKIKFSKSSLEIPLSKSYYKIIKSALSV